MQTSPHTDILSLRLATEGLRECQTFDVPKMRGYNMIRMAYNHIQEVAFLHGVTSQDTHQETRRRWTQSDVEKLVEELDELAFQHKRPLPYSFDTKRVITKTVTDALVFLAGNGYDLDTRTYEEELEDEWAEEELEDEFEEEASEVIEDVDLDDELEVNLPLYDEDCGLSAIDEEGEEWGDWEIRSRVRGSGW